MINKKCNCEDEVSNRKLAVLKTASSERVALAIKYYFETVGFLKRRGYEKVTYSKSSFIKK